MKIMITYSNLNSNNTNNNNGISGANNDDDIIKRMTMEGSDGSYLMFSILVVDIWISGFYKIENFWYKLECVLTDFEVNFKTALSITFWMATQVQALQPATIMGFAQKIVFHNLRTFSWLGLILFATPVPEKSI